MRCIDSHTHLGTWEQWHCETEELLRLMDENGVDIAVTGHQAGNGSGAFSFQQALRAVHGHEDRFRLMLWVNPRAADTEAAGQALREHRGRIACLKAHPLTARLPLSDKAWEAYLPLCREYSLPFVSHTEQDGFSDIQMLSELARKNPDISFIAVHTQMRGDHAAAARVIRETANLYGDTTFLPAEEVPVCINIAGEDKLLFGTDAPIYGPRYAPYLRALQEGLQSGTAEKLFHKNAEKLFRIP